MYNANKPDASELPSTARLLKSTGIAAAVAGALLVTVVLPAEYGVDPTRIGSVVGLTEMGRIKQQLAEEAAQEDAIAEIGESTAAAAPPPLSNEKTKPTPTTVTASAADETVPAAPVATEQALAPIWRDEITFTLAADAATEYKMVMAEGETAEFIWFTDGARVNYDTHGDRPGLNYHGYEKGSVERLEGTVTAAFDGSHGWYWRNRSGAPLTVTLKTRGEYADMKRVL